MSDSLTQSEVEALLAALDPEVTSKETAGPAPAGNVTLYDFKRPERVSRDQIKALGSLHEHFSRAFGAAMSGMLRTIVEVKLVSVDELMYSEFVFSLENPTCFNLLSAEPLEGHLILDINPAILFPIFDRLLGGGREASGTLPRRPLTEIELRLVGRITDLAIEALKGAWKNICALEPKVVQVESNPQMVQIVPAHEVVVLVTFELTMGETRGMINLCIPYSSIESYAAKLTANTWSPYRAKESNPATAHNLAARLAAAPVEMVVYLAETQITTSELLDLRVGDVIVTDKDHRSPLTVSLEGVPKFRARPGIYKGHKAIRVDAVVPRRTS